MMTKLKFILKKLLPKWCFRLLSNLYYYSRGTWIRVSDRMYLFLSYILYTIVKDSEKTKRMKIVYLAQPYSMVGRDGLLATYDIADKIEKNNINGCFIECGVARGGCSAIMAMVTAKNNSNRKAWLFDSFEGLPRPTAEDEFNINEHPIEKDKHSNNVQKGCCLGTYEEVSGLMFSKLKLNKTNIFMVKGWFQNTLPKYKDKIGEISFLRIDADWYASTKCCLKNLYDNIVAGGYIYIDDYESCIGCRKATDEFLEKKHLQIKMIFDNRGGVYFVKP